MMDPGTALALVDDTISTVSKAVRCVKELAGADRERARVRDAAQLLLLPLHDLKDEVRDSQAQPDWSLIACLVSLAPAMRQFRDLVDELVATLQHYVASGRDLVRKPKWPLDLQDVEALLSRIQGIKTLVVLAIERNVSGLSQQMYDQGRSIDRSISSANRIESDQRIQRALTWLSPLDFQTRQQDLFERREEGTGEWLLGAHHFRKWYNESNANLLLIGVAGSGKTYLCARIIDFLQQSATRDNEPVMFIYCNYKEQQDQTVPHLLGSLLQQLSAYSAPLRVQIVDLHAKHRQRQTKPSAKELFDILASGIALFQKTYIVVDALDEIPESYDSRDEFITWLDRLQDSANILVTARPIISIPKSMPSFRSFEITADEGDIRKYISRRLEGGPSLARKDLLLREDIVNTIVLKSQEKFLLVPFYLDLLFDAVNKLQLRRTLQDLPTSLEGTYAATLIRIRQQKPTHWELARRALVIVSSAFRPLTVDELLTAVSIEPGMTVMNEECLCDINIILSVCAGFLGVESKNNIVRLVHYTAQEYIETLRASEWTSAHKEMTEKCITYLSFDAFTKPETSRVLDTEEEFDAALKSRTREYKTLAFLPYAANFLGLHARGKAEKVFADMIISLFSDKYRAYTIMHHGGLTRSTTDTIQPSALHFAAAYDLEQVLGQALVIDSSSIDSIGPGGRTALAQAIGRGHERIVKILLDFGAVPANVAYRTPGDALHVAAKSRSPAIAKMLLGGSGGGGVSVNARLGRLGTTPLHEAAWAGSTDVAALLLSSGADHTARDKDGNTPLDYAILLEREDMVNFLLSAGADVNATGPAGQTPLLLACEKSMPLAQILYSRGAHLSATDARGETALHKAAAGAQLDILTWLLNAGARISAADAKGRTALHRLFSNDMPDARRPAPCLRLLLSRGADVHATDSEGLTVLHFLSWLPLPAEPAADLLTTLTKYGASPNAVSAAGWTPLHYAARRGNTAFARLLLAKGADPAPHTSATGYPLHFAAAHGHVEVLVLLVAAGADLAAPDAHGDAPLVWGAQHGQVGVVRWLLEHGDAGAGEDASKAALHAAAARGDDEVTRLLVERGGARRELERGAWEAAVVRQRSLRRAEGGKWEPRVAFEEAVGKVQGRGGVEPLQPQVADGEMGRSRAVEAGGSGDDEGTVVASTKGSARASVEQGSNERAVALSNGSDDIPMGEKHGIDGVTLKIWGLEKSRAINGQEDGVKA